MNRRLILAASAALLALGGCATPFKADVSRFQAMPAPQGETFTIRPLDAKLEGGLEFQQYANLVAENLTRYGYTRAVDPASASLVVSLDYNVDRGRERIRSTPSFGWDGWGGHPYWGGWGRRHFIYGFYDPFWFGPRYNDIESYTVYTSSLALKIDRRGGPNRVFEGTAKAVSADNDLTRLVPNLIEAMFTGFPGNNGTTVRITVPPRDTRGAAR